MDKITKLIHSLKHKDEVKATTTLQFKKDLVEVLINNDFQGDIIEVGSSAGYTTAILCAIGEILNKHVYSFEVHAGTCRIANFTCNSYGFSNFDIINKDVYEDEWNLEIDALGKSEGIGCVFIDCVHTEECFAQDLMNAEKIAGKDAVIIAHDYGLVTKEGDGIKKFLDKNTDKYEIVKYMGEKDNWNELGSGNVIDWEGIQLKIVE